MQSQSNQVIKTTLSNGMNVLVLPSHIIPKVSVQLWYYVGSKDEQSREKGLAHLLEHMIFKGTTTLSESDINDITHKLSGTCNAFTSYDYTGYLFDFPSQNWEMSLRLLADCMRNCTFKQEHLNSELKAVIQELKMYKDSYSSSLLETMMASIFPDHPYHHPIIGYKQDLWSLNRENLLAFYKRHYVPNNATLVVVGDVEPGNVEALARQYFDAIPADTTYKKAEYYMQQDLASQHVMLYRDIQQPVVMVAFRVPGSIARKEFYLDVLSWILACEKGSRLYRILVDELQLVTDIDAFLYDLFDAGLFVIEFEPKDKADIQRIIECIHIEIQKIINEGISDLELQRGIKKAETDLYSTLESNQKCAYLIGKFFLATGNENYLFSFIEEDDQSIAQQIKDLLVTYFRPTIAHTGMVLPTPVSEHAAWIALQERSDAEDSRILNGKVRTEEVEPAVVASTINPNKQELFDYPYYNKMALSNGLEVLFYENHKVPKIEVLLELKAKSYFDPESLLGLNTFMSALLLEGTTTYTGAQLAQEIESYGMTLVASAGYISLSLLAKDLEKGLAILTDILTNSIFNEEAVEKMRSIMIADIRSHWDSPSDFIGDLVRNAIYKNHPYSKTRIGTLETIQKITREDIINFYRTYVTPQGSRIAIVGDFNSASLQGILDKTIGQWQGKSVESITFPALQPVKAAEVKYPIKRDQVVLGFAGLSVNRFDKDYDALLIFDQILNGGILGSMSSRLFQLREQTGLFYTIGGSLLAHADEQPGIVFIRTIVSLDRLAEAEKAIKNLLDHVIDDITQEEVDSARNAILNSMVDNFETDRSMAATFLTLARYNLSRDYFNVRARNLNAITVQQVQEAARKILDTNKMVIFKIGRIN